MSGGGLVVVPPAPNSPTQNIHRPNTRTHSFHHPINEPIGVRARKVERRIAYAAPAAARERRGGFWGWALVPAVCA